MTLVRKAALAALICAWPLAAVAQQHQHGAPQKPAAGVPAKGPHAGHQAGPTGHGAHGKAASAVTGPAEAAYRQINDRMHEQMNITYSGNPDVDFVRGMIPHHQGAVDMAKTVIAFGKDAEIRKLAEAIVKAQEEEIAQLKAWLDKNAKDGGAR